MHLLPSVAIRPNLELKTRPKQLLGSLPLVIEAPVLGNFSNFFSQTSKFNFKQVPNYSKYGSFVALFLIIFRCFFFWEIVIQTCAPIITKRSFFLPLLPAPSGLLNLARIKGLFTRKSTFALGLQVYKTNSMFLYSQMNQPIPKLCSEIRRVNKP
jgi:hypothetical protein